MHFATITACTIVRVTKCSSYVGHCHAKTLVLVPERNIFLTILFVTFISHLKIHYFQFPFSASIEPATSAPWFSPDVGTI